MLEIDIYQTETGKEPFIEWKEGLDLQTQTRIDARITRIQISGNLGDFKPLNEGVYELRLNFGPGYRVYFGKLKNKIIILLLGGAKKSQTRDIKKAKQYWKDHLSSNNKRVHYETLSKL